jgi:hypothetical protein
MDEIVRGMVTAFGILVLGYVVHEGIKDIKAAEVQIAMIEQQEVVAGKCVRVEK